MLRTEEEIREKIKRLDKQIEEYADGTTGAYVATLTLLWVLNEEE